MKSLIVRSISPHEDPISMPSQWEKYIPSKFFIKRFKKALNLSFETASRSCERLHAAKKNCAELRALVQGACQIAPLRRESIDSRLPAFLGLLSNLNREINKGRNSDEHRRQLPDRCEHFPVHPINDSVSE